MKAKKLALVVLLCIACASLSAVKFGGGGYHSLSITPDRVATGYMLPFYFDPVAKEAYIEDTYWYADSLLLIDDNSVTHEFSVTWDVMRGFQFIDYDSLVKLFETNKKLLMVLSRGDEVLTKELFSDIDSSEFTRLLTRTFSLMTAEYIIYEPGPAGGIIVYDKGYYSDGWRYIEAAPFDLKIVNGLPSVDNSDPWYDFSDDSFFVFGCLLDEDGLHLYVNGSHEYDESNCTRTGIGEGKRNTLLLVETFGEETYVSSLRGKKTSNYAAKLCYDLEYNGFDDWFLPSKDELDYLLKCAWYGFGVNGHFYTGELETSHYWSSSENEILLGVYNRNFHGDGWRELAEGQGNKYRVRPIRYF